MAIMKTTFSGMDVFDRMAANSAKDLKAACNAGGEAAKRRVQELARQMLSGPYGTGETASTAYLKKAKKSGDGFACYITWKGTRSHGNPRRRAEVAFVNEYGVSRAQSARPFNQKAVSTYGDEIQEAMEKALPKY